MACTWGQVKWEYLYGIDTLSVAHCWNEYKEWRGADYTPVIYKKGQHWFGFDLGNTIGLFDESTRPNEEQREELKEKIKNEIVRLLSR